MNKTMGWMGLSIGVLGLGALMGCGEFYLPLGGDLTAAQVDGSPAQTQAAQDPHGVTVRMWSEHAGSVRGATLTLGASLEAIAAGVHRAAPDAALLEGEAIDLAIASCEGPSLTDPVCVPTVDAEVEVTDLEDGARQVSYRATRVEADGTRVLVEGSFVFVADAAPAAMPR